MWRARLILSTLEPETNLAARLRISIRRGDQSAADGILALLVEKRIAPLVRERRAAAFVSKTSTVLPPHPETQRGRVA